MFMERLSLFELDPLKFNGLDAAVENAIQLTVEILELLRSSSTERAA